MTDRTIALDLEGVLAEPHGVTLEHSDVLTEEHYESWVFEDDAVYDHFQELTDRLWAGHWPSIPPADDDIGKTVRELSEYGTVDIVTNRNGRDAHIRAWLDDNDVDSYGTIVSNPPDTDKSKLDYDVYVDDNPLMAGEVDLLFLRDRPWNQTERGTGPYVYDTYESCYVETEGYPEIWSDDVEGPRVIRVTRLGDVVHHLVRKFYGKGA